MRKPQITQDSKTVSSNLNFLHLCQGRYILNFKYYRPSRHEILEATTVN